MILSQAQANGVAQALSELNNIGAAVIGSIKLNGVVMSMWSDGDCCVSFGDDCEVYANQSEFFSAYGLN